MFLSSQTTTIERALGLNVAVVQYAGNVEVYTSLESLAFHTLIVSSLEAETISLPSGLYVAEYTQSVCPSKTRLHSPVAESQIRIVLSEEAETISLPSGLYAAEYT